MVFWFSVFTMINPDLSVLFSKYPQISKSDFVLVQVAAKIGVIENMLVEKLFHDSISREKAFQQMDSDSFSLIESYLVFLSSKPSAASDFEPPVNPEYN